MKKAIAKVKLAKVEAIAIAFPMRGGTCSTIALLLFAEMFFKVVFCLVFFNCITDLGLILFLLRFQFKLVKFS